MTKNNNKHMSIREIAQISGVSTATVSRVINNPELTSPKIRKKVLEVIEEYNYVPNQFAKNIFSKKSNTIAIFVYDMGNPFFIKLLGALNRIAFDNNYTLIICDTENDKERELKYLRYCQSTRVDGVIITEGTSSDICRQAAYTMRIVLLDRLLKDCSFPIISSDNHEGISKAIGYLQNLNHRRIAFVAGPHKALSALDRLKSYKSIMNERGLEVPEDYIYQGDFSVKSGVRALDHFLLLKEKPTAIICSNDLMARGVLYQAQSLGINIPNDLSVIGFDGVTNEYSYPKLTSIQQDVEKISSLLMEEVIDDKKQPEQIRHLVPVKLVIGATCRKV